jgi:hypothetical protein
VTALSDMYAELRATGRGHASTVAQLARRIGVDTRTVQRVLDRAKGVSASPTASSLARRPAAALRFSDHRLREVDRVRGS